MEIKTITHNKKDYLDLLLLADEEEAMIDRYLERGEMFALYDKGILRSICVVTDEGAGVCELKNLATAPSSQKRGYGRLLVHYLVERYRNEYDTMLVGTGDVPSILRFYKKCGFTSSHRIANFFTDNYPHPIIEEGQQLKDMVYLKIDLRHLKLHHFLQSIDDIPLPEKFTYPFHYTPHPLCVLAAKEVQAYLERQENWKDELKQGKMFGVLVVQTQAKEIGYLAAFSGILDGKNDHPYFVPPVYDLLRPGGLFKKEEESISAINARIEQVQTSEEYLALRQQLEKETLHAQEKLEEAKAYLKVEKEKREARRLAQPDEEEIKALIKESQYQKAEFKRLKQRLEKKISSLQNSLQEYEQLIGQLKTERKTRSAALQRKLFEQFRLLNAKGETKDLYSIFQETVQRIPPAGTGECAAPKLLQYAYLHHMKPVAMAEFWWGDSPKAELRRHGYYYPACKEKCEPVLQYMLQGMEVEENPLTRNLHRDTDLEILYEDEWLLVANKPAGMLSVPGKNGINSVYACLRAKYPDATGPMIVHRLDMATSGLLLIAKTKEVHKHLQIQFKNHHIRKRYIALLEGIIGTTEGTIRLPLSAVPTDRPRQTVDEINGKTAVTRYRVLGFPHNRTLVAFYPLTGRTHQLRIHSAHPSGLNTPIVGDELYGKQADRLYLHAESIEFEHPVTGKRICIEKRADFY